MSMSRKDFINIADSCVQAIRRKTVKKKDIDKFIDIISCGCHNSNYNFDFNRFEKYIKDRINA